MTVLIISEIIMVSIIALFIILLFNDKSSVRKYEEKGEMSLT